VDSRIVALVELAQGGDREAFGQLYDAYVDSVHRYLYVRVGQRALAEDLTSETFVRAMRRIDSFTWQGKDIAAWFITIARNLVADHVKSARFRFEVTTADMRDADVQVDGPEEEVLTHQRDEQLVRAIRTLRPDQAECITLRFLQGLTLAETARVLGRSEGAVKQLQLRAIRALRISLDGLER
jgi:RNA polymerase sigma-70 factor (ECF subfamily)